MELQLLPIACPLIWEVKSPSKNFFCSSAYLREVPGKQVMTHQVYEAMHLRVECSLFTLSTSSQGWTTSIRLSCLPLLRPWTASIWLTYVVTDVYHNIDFATFTKHACCYYAFMSCCTFDNEMDTNVHKTVRWTQTSTCLSSYLGSEKSFKKIPLQLSISSRSARQTSHDSSSIWSDALAGRRVECPRCQPLLKRGQLQYG